MKHDPKNKRYRIMLVDDNPTHLATGKNMLRKHFEVYDMPSPRKLFEFVEIVIPDLILLDVDMPEMSGYEVIVRLKENEKLEDVPIIFVTSRRESGNELKGLSLGAVDYVTKPFSAPRLIKRIENHLLIAAQRKQLREQSRELRKFNESLQEMVQEQTKQILNLQGVVLSTVSELVECRDDVTGNHIARTKKFLKILISRMLRDGVYRDVVESWNINLLLLSSQLHDVGKIGIRDSILKKPGKLTFEEFEQMKKHPDIGVGIITSIERQTEAHDFLRYAKIIAGTHHEKWDGSGYPRRLEGTDIPLAGRLMAIADVFDALISRRPYKDPISPEEAADIIISGQGTHFEPALVDVFKAVSGDFAAVVREDEERRARDGRVHPESQSVQHGILIAPEGCEAG